MKLLCAVAVVYASLPHFASALIGDSWSFETMPSGGLTDVTFPLAMPNAPHVSGYFFAQQFIFANNGVGYTGLQPRSDRNGKSIVYGVFSSFIEGSTSNDANCHPGADGGPGVSCAVEIEATYDTVYNLVVQSVSNNLWTGTLVDTKTQKKTHIGSYTLPAAAGNIKNGQAGFVEYYLMTSLSWDSCKDLPWTQVFFGNPTTTTAGAGKGTVGNPYSYGDCHASAANFTYTTDTNGFTVSCGFASNIRA
ncbi:hypothetical protein BC940DRAFT_358509 [Gongronella butleri]|nr:hypothetical protein BC940DRAFT_358509 [Gongronella butleri]